MNEIKLNEIEVKYTLPTIVCDLAPLKLQVKELIEQYKGLVVTEDDIESSKKTVANINKTAKALSDMRIKVVKEIKAPIDNFETAIKNMSKDLENVAKEIKDQLDIFTLKEKENKRQEILESEHWADYMNFDEKWLNKGFELKDVFVDLQQQKGVFQNNSLLITATCSGLGLESHKYLEMLANKRDVNEIVAQITNDNQVKQDYATAPQQAEKKVEPLPKSLDASDITLLIVTLKFEATLLQLQVLKSFLLENNIKYEKV